MDLKLIHTFLTAAKENNLTKTAQILGYAQSTITSQIKSLEDELHLTLFDRLGKSVYLSNDGKAFLPYATRMIALEQEIIDTFTVHPELTPLTIGVSQSLADSILPAMIGQFQKLYPDTPVTIRLDDSSQLAELLKRSEIDVAVCMKHHISSSDLYSYETKKEPISFFAGWNHPLKDCDSFSLADLCRYPLILTAKNCYYHNILCEYLASVGQSFHTLIESDDIHLLKQFAMTGTGILFLPKIAVAEELCRFQLVQLFPQGIPPFYSSSQILLHRQKHQNLSLQRFLALAKDYFTESSSRPL